MCFADCGFRIRSPNRQSRPKTLAAEYLHLLNRRSRSSEAIDASPVGWSRDRPYGPSGTESGHWASKSTNLSDSVGRADGRHESVDAPVLAPPVSSRWPRHRTRRVVAGPMDPLVLSPNRTHGTARPALRRSFAKTRWTDCPRGQGSGQNVHIGWVVDRMSTY